MGSSPIVLALCGRRRTGKDTLATHLVANSTSECAWWHAKVSKELKKCVSQLFNLTDMEVEGPLKDKPIERDSCIGRGVTPRQILQWFGTDVMQHSLSNDLLPDVGRHFWINRTILEISERLEQGYNVVLSDIRFSHELDVLEREFKDRLVKLYLVRDMPDQREETLDSHESEANVEDALRPRADVVIFNQTIDIVTFLNSCNREINKRLMY